MKDSKLYDNGWGKEYPRFFHKNIGNPSAPITVSMFESCVAPFLSLESINAIGLHTLWKSSHLPDLSVCEIAICEFVARVLGSSRPESWAGFSCTGATLANIQVVWLARECAERMGLRLVVFASESAHYSMKKALRVNAIPETSIVRPGELHHLSDLSSSYVLVWLTYGDTHSGAFETPDEIDTSGAGGVFRHLDAAYGGLLAPMSSLVEPKVDLVDTCVVDFHKTGRLPLTRSFFILRGDLLQNNPFCEAYIPYGKDFTLQGSRPFSHTMQMYSYVTKFGYEGHAEWVRHVEAFAEEITNAFDNPLILGLTRSANMLFFRLGKLDRRILNLLDSFNVSGNSLKPSPATIWRVFAWPELGRQPYTDFLDLLAG